MSQSNGKTIRMTNKFWSGYFIAFLSLKQRVLERLEEFKKIEKIKDQSDIDLSLVKNMIMESVILDMAKILGVTGADQTGIKKLVSRLSSKKFVKYIDKLKKLSKIHKQTIIKIKNNRNRIISHLDFHKNPYYKMKLSEEEVERIYTYSHYGFKSVEEYENIKKHAKQQLVTKQKRNQQYRPADFRKDMSIFESIVQELSKIFDEVNMLYYK